MKKIVLAIAAAIMMSANVMAQEEQKQERQPRQFDRTEMIKNQTNQMIQEYGLNEEQGKKLLELNTNFSDKMPMMGRGFGGPRGQRGQAQGQRPQRDENATQGERPQRENGAQGGQQRPRMNREEMMKNMEAYNKGLEDIMSAEQFQKYKDNMQKRMQRPRGNRGRRQQQQQQQQ
ncbi:MAG: DUF4890 domain-containing protein [Prevotella sp.]|nr:DUF4890 domain-containing protein [Prevotella sp.]